MHFRVLFAALVFFAMQTVAIAQAPPNVLVILVDDLGYGDVGFQGCTDIPTPNLDLLASSGIRCSAGYVSHPVCGPSRAGLMTGRYQQRFGFENNPPVVPNSITTGMPLSETTLPQISKNVGYTTAAIGKWHLGAHPQLHPNTRGFDHFFGFIGGGLYYLPRPVLWTEYTLPLDRNGVHEVHTGHLTDALANDALQFISSHTAAPWFMYLSMNAPHTPLEPTSEQLARVSNISDPLRQRYAGLVVGMDDAIGRVLETLQSTSQRENTLIIFLSDNGGNPITSGASNAPLGGYKGTVYEGGVRVPFILSWPARLAAGQVYNNPVSSLDILPTVAAAVGATLPPTQPCDGVNLLPYLLGETSDVPHERLFWRIQGAPSYGMRRGNWKLVYSVPPLLQLYDLSVDPGETNNLISVHPELAAELDNEWRLWDAENPAVLFEAPLTNRPILQNSGELKFTENNSSQVINNLVTVSDPDHIALALATIRLSNFAAKQDVLSFEPGLAPVGNIAEISNRFGTIILGSSGATATLEEWQNALRSVRYRNISDNPITTRRAVSFHVNDISASSDPLVTMLEVLPVNDVPILENPGNVTVRGSRVGRPIAGFVKFSDVDSPSLTSATFRIMNFSHAEDKLDFIPNPLTMGNINVVSNANGVLTLASASASRLQWHAAIRSVQYRNTNPRPVVPTRSISLKVRDNADESLPLLNTVNILPRN